MHMDTGIAVLNFGEPEDPVREHVIDYLERIFLANMDIEPTEQTPNSAQKRANELAQKRAPALINDYRKIAGSPLNEQARKQSDLLAGELSSRGYDVRTYTGFQFIEPLIENIPGTASADNVERLIGLPVYPLCGPSTTVRSLERLATTVTNLDWSPDYHEITGWHLHPTYLRLRADAIRDYLHRQGLQLNTQTELVFSAHGTPSYYIEEGSRYVQYVEEYTDVISKMLGASNYTLGYQNHENRDVEWTQPEIETAIESTNADRIIVDAVSFMHEQSETLVELDIDLRNIAEQRGVEFHRVPIPYDDERFIDLLAEILEPYVAGFDPEYYRLEQCHCRGHSNAVCLNAYRAKYEPP